MTKVKDRISDSQPLQRMGDPVDIGRMALFLGLR